MAARGTSIVIGSAAVAQRLGLGSIIASASSASRVVGVFTNDVRERAQPSAAGRTSVHELSEMARVVQAFNVRTALLTDATDAQAHAQLAIDAGCTRIVNLTSAPLIDLPHGVEHETPLVARLMEHAQPAQPILPNAVSLSAGRLEREYELVGPPIGRGGFGVVLRARNRLDGCEYAVKRVEFHSRRDGEGALREAQAMAKIARACPQHIVQYYCSWVEAADEHGARALSEWSSSVGSSPASSRAPASASGCGSSSSCAGSDAAGEHVVLHLVMELMQCNTLRAELLGARRAWTDEEVCSIIEQLALALAHVHAAGYVHRDVAPANVFLERPTRDAQVAGLPAGGAAGGALPRVKLGDFGLAQRRAVAAPASEGAPPAGVGVLAAAASAAPASAAAAAAAAIPPLAMALGTYLYAAPEQYAPASVATSGARGSVGCAAEPQAEPSADVFSLGVLCAELLHGPFSTLHERAHVLGAFRTAGQLPRAVLVQRPTLAAVALRMTAPVPSERPTAAEVADTMRAIAAGLGGARSSHTQAAGAPQPFSPSPCSTADAPPPPLPVTGALTEPDSSAADSAGGAPHPDTLRAAALEAELAAAKARVAELEHAVRDLARTVDAALGVTATAMPEAELRM